MSLCKWDDGSHFFVNLVVNSITDAFKIDDFGRGSVVTLSDQNVCTRLIDLNVLIRLVCPVYSKGH
jgi:hypothetical protein